MPGRTGDVDTPRPNSPGVAKRDRQNPASAAIQTDPRPKTRLANQVAETIAAAKLERQTPARHSLTAGNVMPAGLHHIDQVLKVPRASEMRDTARRVARGAVEVQRQQAGIPRGCGLDHVQVAAHHIIQ